MKKIKVSFDTWVQLLGMVGVLGGLVFVGLEMQQTQKIAIAGQVQARAQMQVDRILTGLEGNLDSYRLFNASDYEFDTLNEDEKTIARNLHNWKRTMLENNFFQYQSGLFTEAYWEQTKERIQNWYDVCELRPSGRQIAEFQAYLDSIEDNCAD